MLSYQSGWKRSLLFITVVLVLSYTTAFMETLTISSFPYYSFEDRNMAYTAGSAFYGIYFIVSFPMFYVFDDNVDRDLIVVEEKNGCSMKFKNKNSFDDCTGGGGGGGVGVSIWR